MVVIYVGNYYVVGVYVLGDGGGYVVDGFGVGNQYVFVYQVEVQCCVYCVVEGVENSGDIVGNVVGQFEGIEGGQYQIFGEGVGVVDVYFLCVVVQVVVFGVVVVVVFVGDVVFVVYLVVDFEVVYF